MSLARRLARRDPERAKSLLIVSCADGWLSQFYEGRILAVKGNFAARAKAAVALLENLRKNPDLSHIIMTIRWDFSALQPGAEGPHAPPQGQSYPPLPWIQDAFYEDSELNEMMLVERLLRESTDLDRALLWHLLQGEPYQKISEKCFLTESAIKYRIKKMVELCRVEGRQQLVALLNEYLPQPLPGRPRGALSRPAPPGAADDAAHRPAGEERRTQMVLILVEPSYSRSIWCLNLLDGLTGEFKQKRVPFRQIASLDVAGPDDRYIYLIGSDNAWVRAALAACNRIGIYPILLCNQAYHTFDADYSTVCSDVINSMRRLVELLRGRGHGRIALYGVNPQSVSDESRMDSYLAALGGEDGRRHVFFNSGSLENCFEQFMARAQQYDAVICANDFAAISLVRRLGLRDPALLERLAIAGCADARLTQLYGSHILSVRVNFVEYGRAAVTCWKICAKTPICPTSS